MLDVVADRAVERDRIPGPVNPTRDDFSAAKNAETPRTIRVAGNTIRPRQKEKHERRAARRRKRRVTDIGLEGER